MHFDLKDDEDEEDDEEDEEEEDEDDEDEEDEDEEECESDVIEERVPTPKNAKDEDDLDTDQETDRLLGQQYNDDNGYFDGKVRKLSSRTIYVIRFKPRRWENN